MSELQSCYFCGTVGESLREYATVPERLDPSEEEQRTVVLCTTCQEKLRRVVEPLVARLDEPPSSPDSTDRRANVPASGDSTYQEVTFESSAEASPEETDEPESEAAGAPETAEERAPPTAEAPDDEADAETDESTGGDEEADDDTPESAGDDVPPNYYKVMRLLQNREFPIDRGQLAALITGAYDVSDRECEEILETAKERGVLVESDGSLRLGS